jgi:hypothetical protein
MLVLIFMLLQGFSTQASDQPKRPREVLALVDQARALPPEFRADTLLRLSDSPLVTETTWKQELIEEAFWSGAHAPLPYPQWADLRSDSVAENEVRQNRIEALTLQTRAVQAMLALDAQKALHLYEQVQTPTLPKLACSTVFTPVVLDYYQTAVFVFEGAFTPKQRKQGDDFRFLQQLIASVQSPSQVSPAFEMIFAVKVSPTQRLDLLSLIATKLQGISRSDREYGATETALVSAVTPDRLQPSEAGVLLPALRSYIVRHVSGRRCTDNIPPSGKIAKSAESFNTLAAKFDPAGDRYKPISTEETKPLADDGSYQRNLAGQSAQSQAIHDELRWLTHGDREQDGKVLRWTLEERSTQDWRAHYDDAVKLVYDLKENDERSLEAFFCTKSDALNILAVLVPPGLARERAMDEYREFLEQSYSSIQNHNLWFTMFRHMLYTARFSDDPKDKAWILDELAGSSNPVIALYAKLETRIGPPSATYPAPHVQPAQKQPTF